MVRIVWGHCRVTLAVAAIALSVLGTGGGASAAIITSLHSTGVDGSGAVLPVGSTDGHYTVNGGNAYVVDPFFFWVANTSTSAWISAAPNGDPGAGSYSFATTFDLTGFDLSSVVIQAQIAADLEVVVKLNGTQVFQELVADGNTPWAQLVDFTINSGFVSGTNTLTFEVPNNGGSSGLQFNVVSATGNELAAVPEPGSLTLLGVGVAGLAGYTWRRRKTAPC